MANPVLSRPDAFTPQAQPYVSYEAQGQAGPTTPYAPPQPVDQGRMTIDDVITKTAITLGILVLTAAASWILLPDELLLPVALVAGLVSIVVPLLVAVRRKISPALVLVYAAIEGVFIGGFSMLFETYYPGIVMQAVVGTFIAAGLTLAAFRFTGFRLSNKARKVVYLSIIGVVIAAVLNFVLLLFGVNLGLVAGVTGDVGALAWLFAGIGVVLAVLSLVDDFQYIERGVAIGAPASESWRAAFGLTVTMVWLYTNLLRILSYIRR